MTITRPDLSLAVNHTCQHMQTPAICDLKAVKRLFPHLKGTLHHGLTFSPGSFEIHDYSDAD